MSEHTPEKKSASEKMVAMLNDLIESCPGEGKPEKLAFVITGLVFASKLSIKSFDQVVNHALEQLQKQQATKSAQEQSRNN